MIRPGPSHDGAVRDGNGAAVITPLVLARTAMARWRLVLAIPLVTALAAAASSLVFREYTAKSRFLPQSSRGDVSRLAGLAAQMGFAIGNGGPAESPDFYADLVVSGEVLGPAVQKELRFVNARGDTITDSYMELLGIEGDTPAERLQNAVDVLRDNLSASASVKSGLVTVRTTAPSAGIAESINAVILELLASFDRERRQAGARAERIFVEDRLAAAKNDLTTAETALATFLDRNRRPEAPRLVMEMERLQRQVALRQQVYAALAQAYEQASLEEVRNTPVITVVDRPEGSARRGRGIVFLAALGLVLGTAAAAAIVFAFAWLESRKDSPAVRDLQQAIQPWRRARASTGTA